MKSPFLPTLTTWKPSRPKVLAAKVAAWALCPTCLADLATPAAPKIYAIVGESGSGKTTFLSLLSALDKLQDGDIKYNLPCAAASSAKSKQRLLTQSDIFALLPGTFYGRLLQKTYHTAGTTIARRHKAPGIAPSSLLFRNYILRLPKYTNSP